MTKDNIKTLLVFLSIGVILFILYKLIYHTYDYNVYFLNTNESDAIVIKSNKSNILIDTAEELDKQNLITLLAKLNITNIDYLILSHPDKDHIGNAQFIINNYKVLNVIEPNFNKESKLHNDLRKALQNNKTINHIILNKDYNFEIDNMKFDIIAPTKKYKDDNDYSLVTYLTIDNIKYLFPGDINQTRIDELLKTIQTSQILKLPHHGRYNDSSLDLIKKTNPKHIISTGDTDKEILTYINKNKIDYYNTENNILNISTNGNKIKILRTNMN